MSHVKPSVTPLCMYDYIGFLPNLALAWEYVRRSQAYRQDWRKAFEMHPDPVRLGTGVTLYPEQKPDSKAKSWGLRFFR